VQVSLTDSREVPIDGWPEESRNFVGKFTGFSSAGWYLFNTIHGEEKIEVRDVLSLTRITKKGIDLYGKESV